MVPYGYLLEHLPRQAFDSQLLLLARNFGSFAAIREGLREAKGDYLAVMAADLQEPIELMERFFTALAADEADVVVGSREGVTTRGCSACRHSCSGQPTGA
jgi:glycosyltransferase involved in cell wall biosynthesis